jgi:hypothetical protein
LRSWLTRDSRGVGLGEPVTPPKVEAKISGHREGGSHSREWLTEPRLVLGRLLTSRIPHANRPRPGGRQGKDDGYRRRNARRPGGVQRFKMGWASAAAPKQPQQHHEQVDEVEVERQRAHHHLAAGDGAVILGTL